MREDDIRLAIERLEGEKFERFARELLSRELYPGLNPTSRTHDLGEDARTEPSTLFLHDGKWISLAISKESGRAKIKKDCDRCKITNRKVDILVFVTAGNQRTNIIETWKVEVKKEYGWDLEVHTIEFLAPFASRPQYEGLVDDYLQVPPIGEDFIQVIMKEIALETDRATNQIRMTIPGIQEPIPRNEVDRIEDQLQQSKPVIVTGEPGSGKSGIAAYLTNKSRKCRKTVLLLDARRVADIQKESDLRQHLCLKGPVINAIGRIGEYKGCRLIIDQLDNVVGLPAADILIELAIESANCKDVEVVVLSRTREGHENNLLKRLMDSGFNELTSYPLSEDIVENLLMKLGISNYSENLIELGRNLLNLELIGLIKQQQPSFNFLRLVEEIDLWDNYCKVIIEHEKTTTGLSNALQIIAEAIRLALIGLNKEDRSFILDFPFYYSTNRLISWGIILQVEGRIYRFRHEELQDYLYAKDVTDKGYMPRDVLKEIKPYRTRNVFIWMKKIYQQNSSRFLIPFLKELFDVNQ